MGFKRESGLFVVLISLVAATGGLLFGFDTAVISGTVGFFRTEFELSTVETGWVASSALIGCIIGALCAGPLSDALGRKKVLFLTGIFFAASAVWCGLLTNATQLVWARLLGGIGVGTASLISPLYIAEAAPARVRGRLVSLQQLTIVIGILTAYFSNSVILGLDLSDGMKWRWMFTAEAFPAVAFILLLVLVPESPRWLVKQERSDEALAIMIRVSGRERAAGQIAEIEEAVAEEGSSFRDLLKPGLRKALLIGMVLAVLQQITGINAILYYAPEIFKQAGAGVSSAFDDTVLIGLINLVFTLVAMCLVDRFGRRRLLILGPAGMAVSLSMVAAAFHWNASSDLLLAAILAYVASFAVSMGPVVWIVISEIFPTRTRGRAMSAATVVLWASCYVVSQTFPVMAEAWSPEVTFSTYAVMCVVTILFVWRFVPETKGKSLEAIERSWVEPKTGLR